MKRLVFLFVALSFASASSAQTYPTRPLRIIIPWPPGQATDLAGRIVALKLSELLGQQVIADNRPGAGGMIGTDVAAKATPDGYTLLAASSGPVTINPLLQKAPYDVARDLAPVANVGLSPYILVTNPKFPAANAREFIAVVKASPGKYSFASSGTGATAHLVAEWFNGLAGLQVTHVPYKGSAPAMIDVISGQIAYALETAAATMPHVKSGRLKAYGISIARVSALAPGIEPLATSANLPGFDVGAWIGVMVPAGTPKPIVARLTAAVDSAMQAADTRERIAAAGLEVDYRRTEEFARYLKEQQARFSDIIRKNNIRIE
ncbi:MAG TPA: tripartite tricarboxylate transporter substrate binding protein [Burkholderiales bacterium]|nr:tripartite tricarboxylate transporter substrate binding protein [Burkholderiales bacterium]